MVLVMNLGKNMLLQPYAAQLRLFEDDQDAIDYARSIGYESMLKLEVPLQEGMKYVYRGGEKDLDISFIKLPVQAKKVDSNQ